MVLFTCNKKYCEQTIQRLESQDIPYLLQPAGQQNLNVYFGRRECLEAIRLIVTRPLNELTPEEDFILGAMTKSVRFARKSTLIFRWSVVTKPILLVDRSNFVAIKSA